jgi:hypothetical protein
LDGTINGAGGGAGESVGEAVGKCGLSVGNSVAMGDAAGGFVTGASAILGFNVGTGGVGLLVPLVLVGVEEA